MINIYGGILEKANVGLILLDEGKRVMLWNRWMERKTNMTSDGVVGNHISYACPKFAMPKYDKILSSVLETCHGRFISGAVHGIFFRQDRDDKGDGDVRQNLEIEALAHDGKRYVLVQVHDVTSHYHKVKKMKGFIKSLETENDVMRSSEELSKHLAMTDSLTGLSNRLYYMNCLSNESDVVSMKGDISAVVFLDIDSFKSVNDHFGHSIGDEVLRETARRLKSSVRSTDVVARLGGDEFTMLIRNIQSEKDLIHISDKILNGLSSPYTISAGDINISCSFGISVLPNDGTDARELLDKADLALYRVKKSGKNGFCFFSDRDKIYR